MSLQVSHGSKIGKFYSRCAALSCYYFFSFLTVKPLPMDVVKKYQVFCVTENQMVETWRGSAPECCPNDYRHVIDVEQTKQIDQKFVEAEKTQHVYISSKAFGTTNGIYCGEGKSYVIPEGVATHLEDIPITVPMCVFGMRFCVRAEHMGDSVSFVGLPETVVGAILEPSDAEKTIFTVTETVTQNVVPGYYIQIGEEERQVIAVDKELNNITIVAPFTNVHNAGSYVCLNVYIVRNYRLDAPGIFEVGYGAFGGKVIPQGATLRMIYTKADAASTKTFSFNVEFMY